jgi:2-hydroxymuconate-semialdehyde hydrolase
MRGPFFVETGDFATSFHEVGAGPPVVLLHGSGAGVSGLENWRRTIPALVGQFRVIVPDLVGFGSTRPPSGYRYGVAQWTEQIVALMDALRIGRASIVGNSMGGRIAQRLAVLHPDRVARLVLISAASPRPFKSAALDQTRAYKPSRERMRAMLKGCLVHDPAVITNELVDARYLTSIAPGVQEQFEAMFSGGSLVTDDAVSFASLAMVQHATLIVHGREDRVVPADHGWDLAQTIPNAELHLLPKCGHWLQIEAATRCSRLVHDHLAWDTGIGVN